MFSNENLTESITVTVFILGLSEIQNVFGKFYHLDKLELKIEK